MPATDTLSGVRALDKPRLTSICRREFLQSCWHLSLKETNVENELHKYDSYFRHYEESCMHVPSALRNCSHDDFCQTVQKIQPGTRKSCEAATKILLSSTCREDDAARECVEFVGRAILLIDLTGWLTDETLPDFILRSVGVSSQQPDQFRIPLSFNGKTFAKVAGIKITWTRNLLSHLELGLNDSSLAIFHNATVLQLYEQSKLGDIFPKDFLEETRRSLSLMLPVADKASRKWFDSEQRRLHLDSAAGNCPYLRATRRNIQDFDFWRDRLIIAKEAFDSSQPNGLLQFWRDDRNRVQWWTFWIAIVVFFLTVIGVIESALQVYKAYYPSR